MSTSPLPNQIEQSAPNLAISVEAAGVCYRMMNHRIASFKEFVIRRLQGQVKYQEFWALKNINLTIPPGEVFGIIGHNGAGKSTLLKLIARVLHPTTGRIVVRGKVAPLLELSAGFHPELTGRENVYLNGALLGFTRSEMEKKYDRIVDFAELWDFIDAPVRTYSSGMYARLGFAIATDVNPDILLIDEVLAIGDESFQMKSEERLQSFRNQGTTILLVSHSMDAIERMCQRSAWIDQGEIKASGSSKDVIQAYREHY